MAAHLPRLEQLYQEMIGDHAIAVITDAYLKGIRGFDAEESYRLMRRNAMESFSQEDYVDGRGRRALESYMKCGFVPLEDPVKEAFHKAEHVANPRVCLRRFRALAHGGGAGQDRRRENIPRAGVEPPPRDRSLRRQCTLRGPRRRC